MCAATQKSQRYGSSSKASTSSLYCVSEQQRLWRDCKDAPLARLCGCTSGETVNVPLARLCGCTLARLCGCAFSETLWMHTLTCAATQKSQCMCAITQRSQRYGSSSEASSSLVCNSEGSGDTMRMCRLI